MIDWIDLDSLLDGTKEAFGLVVRSEGMRELFQTLRRIAPYKTTVLIEGESGTGKERVAHVLHSLSSVARGPFVAFNCSNLVGALAESQLFGHVRGAFTDARDEAPGYFRAAQGGTLFLDEIGEMPLAIQPKLLRSVENYEIQPVGSTKCHQVNVRLIAATNRDLSAMVQDGQFRNDLYYRISVTRVRIPPLRERTEAIGALAAHFIRQYEGTFARRVQRISKRALCALRDYSWPGNVRELDHVIQNAMLFCDQDCIDLEHLFISGRDLPKDPALMENVAASASEISRDSATVMVGGWRDEPQPLETLMREAVLRSLGRAGGNKQQAAQILGISRPKLYRLIARYGIAERA